jgi:hypothetical protein
MTLLQVSSPPTLDTMDFQFWPSPNNILKLNQLSVG